VLEIGGTRTWGEAVPPPQEPGEGAQPLPRAWGGAVPPPQKKISIFELKKVSFGAFWVLLLQLN